MSIVVISNWRHTAFIWILSSSFWSSDQNRIQYVFLLITGEHWLPEVSHHAWSNPLHHTRCRQSSCVRERWWSMRG
uniref:Uncharacterized protein n=1 Tax=Arundo donax TaxID=35708 RepID=A0A0A9BRQ7_ARUDO